MGHAGSVSREYTAPAVIARSFACHRQVYTFETVAIWSHSDEPLVSSRAFKHHACACQASCAQYRQLQMHHNISISGAVIIT